MLLAQGFASVLDVHSSGKLKNLPEDLVTAQIPTVLIQILLSTLSTQTEDGFWGDGSCEVTAYAVLTISALVSSKMTNPLRDVLIAASQKGCSYLASHEHEWSKVQRLWIAKVSFSSPVLSEAYCLAALSASLHVTTKTEVISQNENDVLLTRLVEFFSRVPKFSGYPTWKMKALLLESNIYKRRLEMGRHEIFPRKDVGEDKYLNYIPFTWVGCRHLETTPIPDSILWDMIYCSMLNYQVEEYIETVVAKTYSLSPQYVRDCISRICGISEHDRPVATAHDVLLRDSDSSRNTSRNSNSDSEGVYTPDETDSEAVCDLSEVERILSKYVMHFLKHPAVLCSPIAFQYRLRVALEAFLLAHLQQTGDNAQLSKQESHPTFSTKMSYFDWVHTISADHTSCPFSFLFFSCLVSKPGEEFFRSVKSKYFAQAAVKHLATLCRQYNDYGSISRESAEHSLNSLTFPDFFEDDSNHHCSDTGAAVVKSAEAAEKRKANLYELAEFECQNLERALSVLEQEVDNKTMGKVMLFVNATKVYGQICLSKDIASRTK